MEANIIIAILLIGIVALMFVLMHKNECIAELQAERDTLREALKREINKQLGIRNS